MFKTILWVSALLFSSAALADVVTVTTSSPTSAAQFTDGCLPIAASASTGSSSTKIVGWYVYVDNVAKYHVQTAPSISTSLCYPDITLGTHNVTIRAWSSSKAFGSNQYPLLCKLRIPA
jgi:hypothetical protein